MDAQLRLIEDIAGTEQTEATEVGARERHPRDDPGVDWRLNDETRAIGRRGVAAARRVLATCRTREHHESAGERAA